ncbi:Rho-GTPase-activating protein 5 [Fonsecaea nubica]|uniref:Rho-GTPase-activating protein 5 n=1 Tax=Fonsecaea nubica TaxID=856822 RepID=A0A178CI15_9EURO|nr:Rho-GTPase-activating protein 5 [Fonsecaea nubica]OAL28692.1 Rho-GTPase-activating protein 5 [Fonsecaea nubica]
MDRNEPSLNHRTSLPYIRPHLSSSQTPPNTNSQDEVERLRAQLASVIQELDETNARARLVTQELNEMKARARLGDYAGGLFNFLKQNSPEDARLKGHANTIAEKIEAADATVAAANKIDSRIDLPTARLAIQEYAARNNMFHSKSMALKFFAEDWTGLAQQTTFDIANLSTILNGSAADEKMWIKIIEFYRDQHIVHDKDAHRWQAKSAAKPETLDSAPQTVSTTRDIRHLPLETKRYSFMMGDFRTEKSSPRRNGTRSDSPDSGQLKRKRELLDEGPETMHKRQEVVDSRPEDADHNDHSAANAAFRSYQELSLLSPRKAKNAADKFARDIGAGLRSYESNLNKDAGRNRRKEKVAERKSIG